MPVTDGGEGGAGVRLFLKIHSFNQTPPTLDVKRPSFSNALIMILHPSVVPVQLPTELINTTDTHSKFYC
jgi:hypothetical protein